MPPSSRQRVIIAEEIPEMLELLRDGRSREKSPAMFLQRCSGKDRE